MNKLNMILLIIFIIALLVILCIIMFKYLQDKIANIYNKLIDSKNDYDGIIKERYDLLISLIKTVETKYKVESKSFDEINKEENINDEELTNKCFKEIIHIKEDNSKVRETKAFKQDLQKYEELELHIISLRTFHNKYTLIFNNKIKKFPYNIISKIKNYKLETLIEGKELNDEFNNDLEV